jgi:hypothetical protein
MDDSGDCFKYWIEVRTLADGAIRKLPLRTVIQLKIPTKKGQPVPPSRERLQIEDGGSPIEGATWEELVAKLRERYPDTSFERSVHRERDLEAERAMNDLIKLIARSAVRKLTEPVAATESKG